MSVHPPPPELQDEDEHARSGHSHQLVGGVGESVMEKGRGEEGICVFFVLIDIIR